MTDVLQATAHVVPALEIIDARIEQFDRDTHAPRKVFDTIADFAANAGVLDHPATGVAWLANRIARYDEQLNAGDFVLSGSFTRPVQVARGDVLHADYGPLGNVAFRFV